MIAIDWGTSSFRAYRLKRDGTCIEKREAPLGILKVQDNAFAKALDGQINDWLAKGEKLVLMSGMIGSRQGWREAAYVPCPGGADELAHGLTEVTLANGSRAWIVAGMITQDRSGVHDVMRGEETQLIGAMHALGTGNHLVCLPGTHSKWVDIVDARIVSFRTHMTGEVFAVLSQHSILARTLNESENISWSAFDRGVERAQQSGGLLHHLFGVRSQALAGTLADGDGKDYLSGLLIGTECGHEVAQASGRSVHLLCAPHMAQRYQRALIRLQCESKVLNPDAAIEGLHQIAQVRFANLME